MIFKAVPRLAYSKQLLPLLVFYFPLTLQVSGSNKETVTLDETSQYFKTP